MTSRLKNHKRPGRLYDPLEYSYLSNKRASSNKCSRAQILQNRTPQIINKTVKLVFIQKNDLILPCENHFDIKISKYLKIHVYFTLKQNYFCRFFWKLNKRCST